MVAEISVLHQEWHAAHEEASQAERKLMATMRGDSAADPQEIEAVCALRAEASRRLQVFLAAAEVASRNCRTSLEG